MNNFFDFVPLIQTRDILAMKPQHSKIDFGLFTRVFVGDTLFYISSIIGITCSLALLISKFCIGGIWNGLDIITFIGWLFFTLVNSYYCGVLTMFFATPISLPFDNMRSAIQAYPTWNLIFAQGYEGWIRIMAESGDQDFRSLWQRYQVDKTGTTFDSVKNGLKHIEAGQNVMYLDKNMLLGYLRSNPTKQKIHMISLGKFVFGHLLIHKNSPLLPIFKQGTTQIRETGLERQLFYKWFGEFNDLHNPEENTLTIGQMVSVFVMMLVVFVVALMVLCGELIYRQFFSIVTMNDGREREDDQDSKRI